MTFSAGVIGCGRMGAFTSEGVRLHAPRCWFPLAHVDAIHAHPHLRLSALVDQDPDALRLAAAQHGVSRTYAETELLLSEAAPDLLCIATRTVGRADIILRGLSAGVSAFHVEKPLCNTMSELLRLETAFGENARFLTLGAVRRHLTPYKRALEVVRSGELGNLVEIQINLGRGALYWTHPHSVDLILMAAGDAVVSGVSARLSDMELQDRTTVVSDPTIESAVIFFDNGVEGRITRTTGSDLILACERGQVIVEADGRAVVIESSPNGAYNQRRDVPLPESGPEGTLAPISQLVGCLMGDERMLAANRALRRDIFLGQRILFAIAQSHVSGNTVVSIKDVSPDWTIWARTGGRPA